MTHGTHVEEVEPIGDGDQACLSEIRDILKKHGKLDRFGVTLLHNHFEMAPDEILVESCDEENRVLTLRPMSAEQRAALHLSETSWRLDTGESLTGCYQACVWNSNGHSWRHVTR